MARPGGGPIALRLALAFVGVALTAVAVLAGLTAVFVATDISHLVTRQQSGLTRAVALAAGAAWDRSDGWASPDLSPVLDLAARVGADVQVRDRAGVIAGAAGLAALLAMLVALTVSRRITLPVARLIVAARAMGGGDRSARVGDVRGPGELRDLSEAFDQMADSLARQEKLRRNLVADVAHELRNPIAVLQAGHEALLDGVAEPTPGQLGSLRDEVLRLARIVDDLGVLASAETAALQLSQRRCDLADIAAGAADSLSGSFDTAGVSIEQRLAGVQIMGDPRRLHEVVTNLLINALKFTPSGGAVRLECGPRERQATLSVSDTGMGIEPDELPHIFERFFRGQQAAGIRGSGIGLTVVAELVRAHDGQLDVTSAPGKGTKITVMLPLAD